MLQDVFKGQALRPAPVWIMRQAGRTLPEYRETRTRFKSFLDLVFTPEAAAEVTLQPLKRFPLLDAAILFSDILVVPHALGQRVTFVEGKGPFLAPLDTEKDPSNFSEEAFNAYLMPIYETVERVKKALPLSKTLIGFAGSPWTVLAYMIEGQSSRDFQKAKSLGLSNPLLFKKLLSWVETATICYLKSQIRAGVQIVQLFDSWAASVPSQNYKSWIEDPTARIVRALKETFPHIPVIGFPKGLGALLPSYVKMTGVDAVSLDSSYPLELASSLPCVVQGNLDPVALLVGGKALQEGVREIYRSLKDKPFIFNLGHGVLPSTHLSHIQEFLTCVKEKSEGY